MKKLIIACSVLFLTSCDTLQQIASNSGPLTNAEVVAGLKEALTIGTQNSTNRLAAVDGFFANAAVKILMPPEAKKVVNVLNSVGFGSEVDKAVLAMNRAAEESAKFASDIFIQAVKEMTITDAMNILKGGDNAATNYFRQKTTASLTAAFRPVVERSLGQVNATKHWNDVFTIYNRFSREKVNTDLNAYVTEKAIQGIFHFVAEEEKKIRENPAARVTTLLKRVFGSGNAQQPALIR